MDNFKDYPQSINEIKSDKSNRSFDWTARDCCIDLLRQIDNGLNIPYMIVCYMEENEEGHHVPHFRAVAAGPNNQNNILGLLSHISYKVNKGCET